jgi:hypothetical protein
MRAMMVWTAPDGIDCTDVHLHAVAWDGTRILPGALTTEARLIKMLGAMPNEDAMNGVERKL